VNSPSSGFLCLNGLSKSFGETKALTDVSLVIEAGTVHSILGENGSGKSTLVKVLSGVLIPDSGSIVIDGQLLTKNSPSSVRRAGIASVFQEVLVCPNRSIAENVLLGQDSWRSWKSKGAARTLSAATVLAELTDYVFNLEAEVGNISLVKQHQVAIARALLMNPKLLVLDESTASLDIHERDKLFTALKRRVSDGMAVVFISHRLEEVIQLSDAVTVLRSGKKIETLNRGELDERKLLQLLSPEAGQR